VFEKLLVDDGILLFKYWLCCDQDKQEERFAERRDDPLKGWKLSPIDVAARDKYDDYTTAREAMLKATHTEQRRGRWSISTTRVRPPDVDPDLLDALPDTHFEIRGRPATLERKPSRKGTTECSSAQAMFEV
jgi:hypothetical protein